MGGKRARCHSHPSPPPAAPEVLCSPHHEYSEPAPGAGTIVGSGGLQMKAKGSFSLTWVWVASSRSSGCSFTASVPVEDVTPPEASQTVTKHPLVCPFGFPLTSPQSGLLGPTLWSHRVSPLHPHQRVQGAGSPGDNVHSPHSSVPGRGMQNGGTPGQEAGTVCVSPYCPAVSR